MSSRLLDVWRPCIILTIVVSDTVWSAVRPLSSPLMSNHSASASSDDATSVRTLRTPTVSSSRCACSIWSRPAAAIGSVPSRSPFRRWTAARRYGTAPPRRAVFGQRNHDNGIGGDEFENRRDRRQYVGRFKFRAGQQRQRIGG